MNTVYASTATLSRAVVVAIAAGCAAGGLLLAALIEAWTGTFSFTVSVLAVVIAAWYGDLAGGLLATTLLTVLTPLLFPSFWAGGPETTGNLVRLAVQTVISFTITALVVRLRAAERRYRLIVETAAEGIWTVGPDGATTFVNRRTAELLGYDAAEMIGRPFADFVQSHDLPSTEAAFDAMKAGVRHFDECGLIRKDGSPLWVLYSATPILDGGTFRGALAMIADISDRRRAEAVIRQQTEQLAEANRMKDEFLATLSHELRTPLNAILGWSDMLLRMKADARVQRRALEGINRAAHAEWALVQDILDVSRIVGGKLRLELQSVDLAAIVNAAVDVVRPAAEAKRIALIVRVQGPSQLVGDPNRLQQIVWNLLSNSIKFTPVDGRIDVTVERVASQIQLCIRDTGIGMPADFLPHVFERFRQRDSSMSRAHTGLGLGLAIVRHLTELHGGTVRAESAGEGQGSTFIVSLPVRALVQPTPAADAHPDAPAPPPSASTAVLDTLRVLVVDDDEDARTLLQTTLESSGARVSVAASALEAIEAIQRDRPDVLIADVGMPEVDGYEMIRRIRTLPAERGGTTPAVALTAYGGVDDRGRALRAGFHHHLTKPVAISDLLAAVAAVTPSKGGPRASEPRVPARSTVRR